MIFSVFTLGCKVNLYQSEGIIKALSDKGFTQAGEKDFPDIILVNTCTVTEKAAHKSKALIRSLRNRFPNAKMVAMGCHAGYDREDLEKMKDTDLVLAYEDKYAIAEVLETGGKRTGENIFPFTVDSLSARTRGLVMVQDGCDSFCSYCILPFIRGPVKSRNPDEIIHEAELQIGNGCREVVITGIHTGAYGKDLTGSVSLKDIVERIGDIQGTFRIRLSSIEIGEIDENLLALFRDNEKMCPHLPVPLQSGSDRILELMNRKYTALEFVRRVDEIREQVPLCAVTTDVMCGFPGETEKDHEETLSTIKRAGFSRVHAFPFSPRKGTIAAEMKPEVPPQVKKERVREVIALGDTLKQEYAEKLIGSLLTVLAESYDITSGELKGYSEYYVPVTFKGDESLQGELVEVKVEKEVNGEVHGELHKSNQWRSIGVYPARILNS
ncbi:tRNA (N(6)-L-threonylcarbamoyladenosine(37)-C(2))-methylthiotransferase MtaB [Planctomycetota bacterium]